jgi:hypothetical protein
LSHPQENRRWLDKPEVRKKNQDNARNHRARVKLEVLSHYGGIPRSVQAVASGTREH